MDRTECKIFISHSSRDSDIAKKFVESLLSLNVQKEAIFYSSDREMGVTIGERFTDAIRENIRTSSIIFLLITPEYSRSHACLQEAGVAWYLMDQKRIYPILIGVDYSEMRGLLDSTVQSSMPTNGGLDDIPPLLKELGLIPSVPGHINHFNEFKLLCESKNCILEDEICRIREPRLSIENMIQNGMLSEPQKLMVQFIRDRKNRHFNFKTERFDDSTIEAIIEWEYWKRIPHTLSKNYKRGLEYLVDNELVVIEQFSDDDYPLSYFLTDDAFLKIMTLSKESLIVLMKQVICERSGQTGVAFTGGSTQE